MQNQADKNLTMTAANLFLPLINGKIIYIAKSNFKTMLLFIIYKRVTGTPILYTYIPKVNLQFSQVKQDQKCKKFKNPWWRRCQEAN